ncbi:MAG: hypothetical protein KDD41_09830 [Flavobacteriales bacterium]|nr:hypothetical protein [Flavobacteriales bacterium]
MIVFLMVGLAVHANQKDEQSTASAEAKQVKSKEGALAKDLAKIKKLLSFGKFFHHSDSAKLAKQFIHQEHKIAKQKNDTLYTVNHEKLNLKVQAYEASKKFELKYEVFGWYPYWETDLYKNLNYSLLSTIAYFSCNVSPSTGSIDTTHNWTTTPMIDSAQAHHINVLLTITNFGESNNKKFLNNDNAIKNFIKQLKRLLKERKANGVCLDFEGVAQGQRSAYAKFIGLLSEELKKTDPNYQVYITVPSVDWAECLDFEALIPVVDRFVIMGYGYYGSFSHVAGPTALSQSGKTWEPYNLTLSVDYYLANKVPSSKLILALPYYGVMWNTESADKGAKVKKFVGNRTYDYIQAKVVGKLAPVQYDTVSQTAWCTYVVEDDGTYNRQCWFDNDSTLSIKLNLIKYKKLKGMGIWALGYDKGYDDFWRVIANTMTNTKVNYKPTEGIGTFGNDTTDQDTGKVKPADNTPGIWSKITDIEAMLQQITNYRTVLLFVMGFVVLFGGAGLVIAMFQPNTRMFFFSNAAYRIYYACFVLVFLVVILRWTDLINDLSIVLLIGFIAGGVAIYFINKYLDKVNKDMP